MTAPKNRSSAYGVVGHVGNSLRQSTSAPLMFKVRHSAGCEDFSELPVGTRFEENEWHRFTSGLGIKPLGLGQVHYPNARIIADGAKQCLSYYFSNDTSYLAQVMISITKLSFPLVRPVEVTVLYRALEPTKPLAWFYLFCNLPGVGDKIFGDIVPIRQGSCTVRIPADALPYNLDESLGIYGSLAVEYSEGGGSSTFEVESVCWKEV